MSSHDSISTSTKEFIIKLNELLRETGHYIDFTNGILYSIKSGYVSAVEDNRDSLLLVEENTGEILFESENND